MKVKDIEVRLKIKNIGKFALLPVLWLLVWGAIYSNYKRQIFWPYYDFISTPVYLEFELAVHEAGKTPEQGQFYFDTGEGFTESRSVRFDYDQDSDGQFKHYSIPLKPTGRISKLRFDPMQFEGRISIKDIVVRQYYAESLDPARGQKSWVAYNGISQIVHHNPNTVQIVSDGPDPHLLLTDNLYTYYNYHIGDFCRYTGWGKIASGAGIVILVLLYVFFI